jgi:hypothetical protein
MVFVTLPASIVVTLLPLLITSPVKFALVVTVEASVAVAAFPPMLKLATGVVELTTKGAAPVAMVEVNCPETLKLVPVATPILGVTKVGEASGAFKARELVTSNAFAFKSTEVIVARELKS